MADTRQRDLIANVSHDLKTPLTMVKDYAEMIRDLSGDNPEKRNKHLQVIINEADRLNGLVNDLTLLSKMQANVDTPDLQHVGHNAYRFIKAVSAFEPHGKPLRQTATYRENLFERSLDGNRLVDKAMRLVA